MISQNFDQLVRLFGAGSDRRSLLKGIVGGTVGVGAYLPAQSVMTKAGALMAQEEEEGACQYLLVFSKKLGGDLTIDNASCQDPCACDDHREVYEGRHDLIGQLGEYPCDETQNEVPDGSTLSLSLTHYLKFNDQGQPVGYHDGTFSMMDAAGQQVMAGRVHGLDGLNSETGECDPGRAEGTLLGDQGDGPFAGCTLVASYRARFDMGDPCPANWRSDGAIIAGIVVCPCGSVPCNSDPTCVDFSAEQEGPTSASFAVGNVTFTASGGASPRFWQIDQYLGLDAGTTLEIDLPPSCKVEVILVHAARAATVTAYGETGVVGTQTMTPDQLVPQTIRFVGTAIQRVVVEPPLDETILLNLCYVEG